MQSSVTPVIFPRSCKHVIHLLRVSLMLMTAILGQAALAQNNGGKLPIYLTEMTTDSSTIYFKAAPCDFLDGHHEQSIVESFDNGHGGPYELRYPIPAGYKHFTVQAGVDKKFPNEKYEFSFTVIGKDALGNPHRLAQPATLHSGGKAQTFTVDLEGISQLILSVDCVNANGYHVICPNLCWADGRFFNEGPQFSPANGWQPECDELVQKLMAQMLTKNLNTQTIALNRFALNPEGFDDNIGHQVEESLTNALKAKPLMVNPVRQSMLDTVKPGDDLSEETCKALRKIVQDFYLLTGRISKHDDKTTVTAAIYDLRTGKSVVDGQVSKMKVVPPPPTTKITLLFVPQSNLRVSSFEIFLDGKSQGMTQISSSQTSSSTILEVDTTGKHKLALHWIGKGYHSKDQDDYIDVTVEDFEIDVQKDMRVELSAREVPPPKPLFKLPLDPRGKLELTVRAANQTLHPNWH